MTHKLSTLNFTFRKFVIVEFSDGLQVVSKNWQIDDLRFYYPNAVKDIKEYNKLLINMVSPDDGSLNWTSYTIKKNIWF